MDQAVEHLGSLLHKVTLIVLQLIVWFQVKDGVQCLAIVRHLLIQASQIKFVLNVIFIHLRTGGGGGGGGRLIVALTTNQWDMPGKERP